VKTVSRRPLRALGFYIAPQFSMISLMCAIEPLRIANEIRGEALFKWVLISKDGHRVPAVNGLDLSVHRAMAETEPLDAIAVCASYDLEAAAEPRVLAWLRLMARHGTRLGAIDTGSHLLAKAGLLDGYRSTIHWQQLETFAEEFPKIATTANLYEIDRDRFSCGGATTGLDMLLHLIEIEHGAHLAAAVSEQLIYARLRQDHGSQRSALTDRLRLRHPKLVTAVATMEKAMDLPLSIKEIATRAGVTVRQLERLFEEHLDCSPSRYYANLRLDRARVLLNQTNLPTLDIALSCGFPSYAHFSRSYRSLFGHPPMAERQGRRRPSDLPAAAVLQNVPG
jgi:AraC family transcriptional regulator, glycine betaine-responsive activator